MTSAVHVLTAALGGERTKGIEQRLPACAGINVNLAVTSFAYSDLRQWEFTAMAEYSERPVRISAQEKCIIAREDGRLASGLLVDVSDEGFCVESLKRLEVGEQVEIRVPGLGRIAGIVRWYNCNRAGGVLAPYIQGACEICRQ